MSIELISLLTDLSEIVGPAERARGRQLFESGAVTELLLQPAIVLDRDEEGGGGTGVNRVSGRILDQEPVDVEVTWASESFERYDQAAGDLSVEVEGSEWQTSQSLRAETVDIEARCSCSLFADGLICPHIWGLFLGAENRGLLDEIADSRVNLTLGSPLGENTVDIDESEAVDSSASSTAGGWRSLVDRVQALSRGSQDAVADARIGQRGWHFWAVLDPDLQKERPGRICLDFFKQAMRRDGTRSALFPTTLEDVETGALIDPKHRRGLALLRSVLHDQMSSERVFLDSGPGDDGGDLLLTALARSGCLRLPADKTNEGREVPRRIRWQSGPGWNFKLRLESTASGDARLEGVLERTSIDRSFNDRSGVPETVERGVSEARLILRQGLVLWPGSGRRHPRLATLELSGPDWPWIQAMRKHDSELAIPKDEVEPFLSAFWSQPDAPEIEVEQPYRPRDRFIAPIPTLVLRLLGDEENRPVQEEGSLLIQLEFDYGGRTIAPTDTLEGFVDPRRRVKVTRDLEVEAEAARQLDHLPNLPPRLGRNLLERGSVVLPVSVPLVPMVLSGLVLALEQRAPNEEWQILFSGRPVEVARRIDGRIDTSIDWFELEATAHFDSGSAPLPELLEGSRRRGGFIDFATTEEPKHTRDRASGGDKQARGPSSKVAPIGVLPPRWNRALRGVLPTLAPTTSSSSALRFQVSQLLLFDSLLSDQLDAHIELDQRATEIKRRLVDFQGITPASDPEGFSGTLRPYQKEGVGWFGFLRDFHLGGCLADDMGLGKTVQVIAHLTRVHCDRNREARTPSLIVVPSSLVSNWLREFQTFSPRLEVIDYTGVNRNKLAPGLRDANVIVTSYGILRRDIVDLAAIRFATVILDEAQTIKNRTSRTTKAVRRLAAQQRLALTGTPVENHLGEAASIFEFLNPGMLHPERGSELRALTDPKQATGEEIARAAKVLRPLILRRTKDEVLTDLPPKTEQTLYVDLSDDERARYRELLRHYQGSLKKKIASDGMPKSQMHVLEALLRLRQSACHQGLVDSALADQPSSKLDTLLHHLEECTEGGHQILVFSQFTSLLSLVEKQLRARGIVYELLHGRSRNRQARVDRFQSDQSCSVFLISLKAGGVGLNLTAADYVFLLDPWWNPATEAQAIDRAHRYGQQRPVFAYRLIARDTVEERIEELKHKKRELAEALLSPTSGKSSASIGALTSDDLERLLAD